MSTEEKIALLCQELNYHMYRYHVLDSPLLSDSEFDVLYCKLVELEKDHPEFVTLDSPTQRIGESPLPAFKKVAHPAPILSLANAYNLADLQAWHERTSRLLPEPEMRRDYMVEPKIDGLSVVLTYRGGQFVVGATRGNGKMGEEITLNLRTLPSVPLRIPVDPKREIDIPYLAVRGEVFFLRDEFEVYNKARIASGEAAYMNPRNAAAGSLRQLDSMITATRPLSLFVYDIVAYEGMLIPEAQQERLAYLQALGFPVSPHNLYCKDLDASATAYQVWSKMRSQINYDVDGIVIKINNRPLAESLGFVGREPRGAIAMKFPSQRKTTKLLSVQANVGRTGILTPNVSLEPVEIDGVIIRNAMFRNYNEVARKDIHIGDTVIVNRAGNATPEILGPIPDLRDGSEQPIEKPAYCPGCSEPTVQLPGEVTIYCENERCPAQLVRRVEHFAGRSAMDIKGFGGKTALILVQANLIQDIGDIYRLRREDMLKLEGYKEKKVDKLLAGIEESKSRLVEHVLAGLSIPFVGDGVIRLLIDTLDGIDAIASASQAYLEFIEGIGPETANSIRSWFENKNNQRILGKLRAAHLQFSILESEEIRTRPRTLTGLTFVITGNLPTFSRKEAVAFIQGYSGTVARDVSAKVDYLVAGKKAGNKLVRARQQSIPILSEKDLRLLAKGK